MKEQDIQAANKEAFIYKISCSANPKLYIGSTVSPAKRKSEHFKKLRLNLHHCKPLQAAFNKYGEAAFEFAIMESFLYVAKEDILRKEQHYLDLPHRLFNTFKTAGSPLGTKYGKYSYERKKNMSNGMRGIAKTADHKKILSDVKLRGTANNKAVISISDTGEVTRYVGVCAASIQWFNQNKNK